MSNISHCTFVGAHYDAQAVETVTEIAKGLAEITKVYGQLAQVLQASNVHIDAMVKVDAEPGVKL